MGGRYIYKGLIEMIYNNTFKTTITWIHDLVYCDKLLTNELISCCLTWLLLLADGTFFYELRLHSNRQNVVSHSAVNQLEASVNPQPELGDVSHKVNPEPEQGVPTFVGLSEYVNLTINPKQDEDVHLNVNPEMKQDEPHSVEQVLYSVRGKTKFKSKKGRLQSQG